MASPTNFTNSCNSWRKAHLCNPKCMFEKFKECHKRMHVLLCLGSIFMVVLSLFFIFKIRNLGREYGYIGRAPLTQYTISIDGEGKVTATPDVAVVSLGVQSDAKMVKDAQADNSKKMNDIVKAVKDAGVKDADIQTTNYNIYPKYSYDQNRGTSDIIGYTVSQSVTVKVRDLDKVGGILFKAGELGANQVGGVQFTVDNPESLKVQAREKAINNAREKANVLFDKLGLKPGRIVSFNESGNGAYPIYAKEMSAYGMGGGAPAPSIETGSLDITVNVSLTFEIK